MYQAALSFAFSVPVSLSLSHIHPTHICVSYLLACRIKNNFTSSCFLLQVMYADSRAYLHACVAAVYCRCSSGIFSISSNFLSLCVIVCQRVRVYVRLLVRAFVRACVACVRVCMLKTSVRQKMKAAYHGKEMRPRNRSDAS